MIQDQMQPLKRSQIQDILAYLDQGVILLNEDTKIIWANYKGLQLHGCEQLGDLGETAADYVKRFNFYDDAQHPLSPDQHPLMRLANAESFADVEIEIEDEQNATRRVMRCRGMVLQSGQGQQGLSILFLSDITGTIELDELFDRFFQAKPMPAVILNLNSYRYIRANYSFCTMSGYTETEILAQSFYQINVLHHAENASDALQALEDNQTIPTQESSLQTREGDLRAILVSGQPIVVRNEPCMLFTFIDLEGRKRAEEALRQSEQRFATTFRLAPVPMVVYLRSNQCVIEANQAYATACGRSRKEIIGYPLMTTGLQLTRNAQKIIRQTLDKGLPARDIEVRLCTPDGDLTDGLLAAEGMMIQEEDCALYVIQDITLRKRTETELMEAIEAVMQDAKWFSRTVMEKLALVRRPQNESIEIGNLTSREHQVLELICNGKTNNEMAELLSLSANTVRNHVATLYSKIGVNNRSSAVIWGRERGCGLEDQNDENKN